MQPNFYPVNRPLYPTTNNVSSYDPSAPYRAMTMPVPSAVLPGITNTPSQNPYYSNNNQLRTTAPVEYDPTTGNLVRIPRYYYPRYDGANIPNEDIRETDPYLQYPSYQPPISNDYPPYSQPPQMPIDPYAQGGYYPEIVPPAAPPTSHPMHENSIFTSSEQTNSNPQVLNKNNADLSRLEVYHFTPKQIPPTGTNVQPPIVQYHVYPYPSSAAGVSPITSSKPDQQHPSYYQSRPDRSVEYPGYPLDSGQHPPSFVETKARSSQTDETLTKTRAVSPFNFSNVGPASDEDSYPYINQKEVRTDRYNIRTGRVNQRTHGRHSSSALPDCRCLDCQRERSKVLNYYPD